MNSDSAIDFPKIARSGRALFLAALLTLPIAIATGFCAGIFFYGIGAVVGALLAIPVGFVAAVFGVASRNRYGWAASGALWATLSIAAIDWLEATRNGMCLFDTHDSTSVWLMVAMAVAAFAGGVVGAVVGANCDLPAPHRKGLYVHICRVVEKSPFYGLPPGLRFAIAAAQAAPIIAGICCVLQHYAAR